jgi:hypothetical protein
VRCGEYLRVVNVPNGYFFRDGDENNNNEEKKNTTKVESHDNKIMLL